MLISIITINFNDASGLEKTINSVLSQTYSSYEHLIIDGNSADGSKKVIEQYNEQLAFSLSEPDTGVYNAMNKGIKASKGRYLLFLNSGDVLHSEHTLEEVSKELSGGLDFYYGNLYFDTNGALKEKTFPDILSFNYFYDRGYLPHPSSFIKRDLFESVGMYNESNRIVSDWEFMILAVCKYNISYKHFDLFVSRFDTAGLSSDPKNRAKIDLERTAVLEKHFPAFLEENKELLSLQKKLNTKNIRLLNKLEQNGTAKKLATFGLKVLGKLFG